MGKKENDTWKQHTVCLLFSVRKRRSNNSSSSSSSQDAKHKWSHSTKGITPKAAEENALHFMYATLWNHEEEEWMRKPDPEPIIPVSRVEYFNRSTAPKYYFVPFLWFFFLFTSFKFCFFPFFHFSLKLCVGTICCCIPELMRRLILSVCDGSFFS